MAENLIYILSISNIIFFFLRQQMRPSANKTKKKIQVTHGDRKREEMVTQTPIFIRYGIITNNKQSMGGSN